ncbi:uncharacterized protein METZ01_LOCUS401439 [marine metagenome]|uniref:Uncharacterized protein n=1 Tax=marine metagenome TaxID=408172 RepID=A0A382VRE7_9ZZZZ
MKTSSHSASEELVKTSYLTDTVTHFGITNIYSENKGNGKKAKQIWTGGKLIHLSLDIFSQ